VDRKAALESAAGAWSVGVVVKGAIGAMSKKGRGAHNERRARFSFGVMEVDRLLRVRKEFYLFVRL
jgi:hypothetical protein